MGDENMQNPDKKKKKKKRKQKRSPNQLPRKHLSTIQETDSYEKTFDVTCIGDTALKMFVDTINLYPSALLSTLTGTQSSIPPSISRIISINLHNTNNSELIRVSQASSPCADSEVLNIPRTELRTSACGGVSPRNQIESSPKAPFNANERSPRNSLAPSGKASFSDNSMNPFFSPRESSSSQSCPIRVHSPDGLLRPPSMVTPSSSLTTRTDGDSKCGDSDGKSVAGTVKMAETDGAEAVETEAGETENNHAEAMNVCSQPIDLTPLKVCGRETTNVDSSQLMPDGSEALTHSVVPMKSRQSGSVSLFAGRRSTITGSMREVLKQTSTMIANKRTATSRAYYSFRQLFSKASRVKVTFSPCFIETPPPQIPGEPIRWQNNRYVALPRLTPAMAQRHALLYFFDVTCPTSLAGFSPLLTQLNSMTYKSRPHCFMIGIYPKQADVEALKNSSTMDDAQFLCDAAGAELYHVESLEESWAQDLLDYMLRESFNVSRRPTSRKQSRLKDGIIRVLCPCCISSPVTPSYD